MKILLIILLASVSFVHGDSVKVATLDWNQIFLLHPKLSTFHFGVGQFYKNEKSADQYIQDMEMLSQRIGILTKEFKQSHNQNREEMVEQQRLALSKMPSGAKQNPALLAKTHEYMKSIEEEFNARYKSKREDYLIHLQEIWNEYFLDYNASRRKFREISREMERGLQELQRNRGLELILRKSTKLTLSVQKPDFSNLEHLVYRVNQGLEGVLIKLYSYQPNFQAMRNEHSSKDLYTAMKNRIPVDELKKYFARYQRKPLVPSFSGEVQDLTNDLLAWVYKQNGMEASQFLPVIQNLP